LHKKSTMIHTTVTPLNTDLHILIPKDYVGKQIEVLLYPSDEVKEEKLNKAKTGKFRGTLNLTEEQYKDFQQYAKDTRNEWNRDI